MTTKKETMLSLVALVLIVAALSIFFIRFGTAKADSGTLPATIPTMDVNTSIGVGPTNTRILATSTARLYARISDASSTNPVFCNLSDAPAVSGSGLVLSTTTPTFTIDYSDLYTGSLNCVSVASTTLSIVAQQ